MTNIIKDFKPFIGQHCETTATGSLLNQLGIELSEPMLFGLGEGLGFIFWNMKIMDFPFIGGRIKPDDLTKNIAKNLNLKLDVQETSSVKKAWKNVKNNIDNNIAVGLKLDCYYLDYFTNKIHFAAHYATIYGYDNNYAYLVDSNRNGNETKATLKNLELARNEKGPMSSKNLSYTIQGTKNGYDLKKAVLIAIKNNAKDYLNPPIKNIGYKGILKASEEIKTWFKNSKDIQGDFKTTAMLMEKAGTGGAIFRNLYRDFLKESYELLKIEKINESHKMFIEIAILWTKVAGLFEKTAETKNIEHINQASEILIALSKKEKIAMELLLKIL
ncbi:MAG: lantibiotic ABC transporter [Candidatus Kerfeldbacteria bacterium RIFOXYA2_FULL_38_24]|nr:MAG: lantibiotic ABC transporter [Candidatus Kerfeldbacteria bacterium RIFOXYA2_FULL_38_24]